MIKPFEIVVIDVRESRNVETLGTKPKFWFMRGDKKLLFKAENRGTGEDWAEKISSHLCELLGLPRVQYSLAQEKTADGPGRPGVICESITRKQTQLILGAELLVHKDPSYPATSSARYGTREHTVDTVCKALTTLRTPDPCWAQDPPQEIDSALGYFVGYVMLDAWIANQDRHHENWAAVYDDTLRLAPTFDHGAALARNIDDEEREERLTTKDNRRQLQAFTGKARSAFYKENREKRPLGTHDAFEEFSKKDPSAAKIWIERLKSVPDHKIDEIIERVPDQRMSEISKRFTKALLDENRRKLLEKQ